MLSHSTIGRGLCLLTTIAVARTFGPTVHGNVGRATASGLLAILLLGSLYMASAHYRAMYMWWDGLDHGFPFPDPAINALERWFDARRPVSPGNLKLHGEYPLVGFVLGDDRVRPHELDWASHRDALEPAGAKANDALSRRGLFATDRIHIINNKCVFPFCEFSAQVD